MKILMHVDSQSGGNLYILKGVLNALTSVGHVCYWWLPEQKSAFDAFNEFNPDIFMSQSYNLNRAIKKCILARPNLKTILYTSAWGESSKNVEGDETIVLASDNEKRDVEELVKNNALDFLWIHYHYNDTEYVLGKWKELGAKITCIPVAGDIIEYVGGKVDPALVSDISIVSGIWKYKSQIMDKYLIPLCHPSSKLDIKIFGNSSNWVVQNYLGAIEEFRVKDVFTSAKICINANEPRAYLPNSAESNERSFKILAANAFPLEAGKVNTIHKNFFPNGEIEYGETPEQFHEKIVFYLQNPELRLKWTSLGRKRLLDEHTYHHRISRMFQELNLPDEAKKVDEHYNNLRNFL